MIDKVPPQAPEIEKAVLGAILLESERLEDISSKLKPKHFYVHEHQQVYNVILEMFKASQRIDLLTVTEKLKTKGILTDSDGPYYITKLVGNIGSTHHLEQHAHLVIQRYIQREVIRIARETEAKAYDDSNLEHLPSLWGELEEELNNIIYGNDTGTSQADVLRETIIELEEDAQKVKEGIVPGINTGFPSLDKLLGGWRKTNLVYLAARPGMGKTSLALKFAVMAAKAGYHVNFFSFEMKKTDLMRTLLSAHSDVKRTNVRDGNIDENSWRSLNQATTELEKLPITWNDNAGTDVNQIQSIVRRNCKANRCDLVIIDYLQLIIPSTASKFREQEVAQISRALKTMALGEDLPVLCLAQLNREADREVPRLSHMRESGSLEQDADIVLFPWRPGYIKDGPGLKGEKPIPPNEIKLLVAKNRRGSLGSIKIRANEEMTRFEEIS